MKYIDIGFQIAFTLQRDNWNFLPSLHYDKIVPSIHFWWLNLYINLHWL